MKDETIFKIVLSGAIFVIVAYVAAIATVVYIAFHFLLKFW